MGCDIIAHRHRSMNIFTQAKLKMRIKTFGFSLIAALAFQIWPQNAFSSDWQAMGLMELGIYYIDIDSIHKVSDSPLEVEVWTMLDYRDPQTNAHGQVYRSTRALMAINCRDKTIKTLSLSWHSGNKMSGNTLGSEGVMGQWQPIPPDTPVVKIQRSVCGHY